MGDPTRKVQAKQPPPKRALLFDDHTETKKTKKKNNIIGKAPSLPESASIILVILHLLPALRVLAHLFEIAVIVVQVLD